MKNHSKRTNLVLPSLNIEVNNLSRIPIVNSIVSHKTSKSVSFPKFINNSQSFKTNILDNIIEKTLPDSHQMEKQYDNLLEKKIVHQVSHHVYNSPLKRLIKYAGIKNFKLKLSPKNGRNSYNSLKSQEIENDFLKKAEKSADLSLLLKKRDMVMHWARVRNSRRILDQLLENLWVAAKLNSLKLLTDTIFLIGDLHLCDGNLEGALYTYLHMKILCDLTQNYKMKLHSILALANCCKILKKNNQALFLYKKALEYVWITKDEETESKIYDRIGMIYFHFGEIRKARYYHDRSLEYRLESEISPSKYSSANALKKFHESINCLKCDSVSTMLLGKLGISFLENTNQADSINELPSTDRNARAERTEKNILEENMPKVKFGTNLNIEALMENLFYEKDLSYEIPSPRYPRGYTQQDILLGRTDVVGINKRPKGGANDMVFSLSQLNLINTNSQRNRKPMVKIDLDPMQMKIPIAEKIKLRNQIIRHLKNKEMVLGTKLNSKQKIKSSELLGFGLFYNHLTPNRNLEAFNYHFKNKTNKLDKYYQNLITIEDAYLENKNESKDYKQTFDELESFE